MKAADPLHDEGPDWEYRSPVPIHSDFGAEPGPEKRFTATPYHWPDPASIEPRDWLFSRWILRGEVSTVIAPGGVGKSSLLTSCALSLASGRNILGKEACSGPQGVWIWNLEDDRREMDRQIAANSIAHAISKDDCNKPLCVDSGIDQNLCTAIEGPDGFMIIEPVFDALLNELVSRKIDVLFIDPFVSSHQIAENDNVKIDAVAKRWKKLAQAAGCAIVLAHHSRKSNGQETTIEDSRGASALGDAARVSLVLNRMSSEEAKKFGVEEDRERRLIFRVDLGKSSRAPAENATWFKLQSTSLGNSTDGRPADDVGVVKPWRPPDPFDDITVDHLRRVQLLVSEGSYRSSPQSKDWVGHAVAEVTGMDVDDKKENATIKKVFKTWLDNEKFLVVDRKDQRGNSRPFIDVGEWVKT